MIELDNDLLDRILAVIQPGEKILTLSSKRPNIIAAVDRGGVWVETLRSQRLGSGPQLVPAWMIAKAWQYLQKVGVLSHSELLEDLNVKRSAIVNALLAQFPKVTVRSTEPIVIELIGGAQP